MKSPAVHVAGLALLIGLAWFVLVFPQIFAPAVALPATALSIILIGALALLLRDRPAQDVNARRAWFGNALVFSAVWLGFSIAGQLFEIFVPSTGINPLFTLMILGLPALFGTLGLISGRASGQARAGAYAGLVAAGVNLALGTAVTVGLLLACWPLFQHYTFNSDWGLDYQRHHLNWKSAWDFANFELTDPDFRVFFFIQSVLYATLGGVLGARRRAAPRDAGLLQPQERAGRSARWPARLVLATLALGVLPFALLAAPLGTASASAAQSLPPILSTVAGFVSWLLILLVVLVALRRAGRPN